MDAMAAIKETFFQECGEQLAELEAGLLAMEEGVADPETINAIFRSVHSIKGGAGAFQLTDLVKFSHVFETCLERVRSGRLEVTPSIMKLMLRAADALADLVPAARDGNSAPASCAAIAEELRAASENRPIEDCLPPASVADDEEIDFRPITLNVTGDAPFAADSRLQFDIRFLPKPSLYANANEPILIIRNLAQLGEITVACDITHVPLLDSLDPKGAYLEWSISLSTEQSEPAIREVFEFVDGDCDLDIGLREQQLPADAPTPPAGEATDEISISSGDPGPGDAPPPSDLPIMDQQPISNALDPSGPASLAIGEASKAELAAPQATIRVDLDRVDRLINLVGELVINRAMLTQRIVESGITTSGVDVGLVELEQLTREIQDSVMAIRAQPVKSLFQRMTRIVREVANATGKSVRLRTDGEATEVDKTVIERLTDPLTHMIRNAVDHGLESSAERLAAGKPEEGMVRLTAAHRSGRIVIEVTDDGAGINRTRVREAAVRKGLISADDQLTDSEIDSLLFMPGFSTVSTVSSISGRGVGMDVVKRSIQALGGRIAISSKTGKGTTFSLSLPLTLAVLDGMVVTVNDRTVVVPITAIVETLQPKAANVHGLGHGSRVIAIRDSFIPLIDVAHELGYNSNHAEPTTGVAILVEVEGGARHALLVDKIQDQRQVVIKSLEANYGQVAGIAAATILGDGRVALILDVDAIVNRSRGQLRALETQSAVAA